MENFPPPRDPRRFLRAGLLLLALEATPAGAASGPALDYALECQGCHRADGSGPPPRAAARRRAGGACPPPPGGGGGARGAAGAERRGGAEAARRGVGATWPPFLRDERGCRTTRDAVPWMS